MEGVTVSIKKGEKKKRMMPKKRRGWARKRAKKIKKTAQARWGKGVKMRKRVNKRGAARRVFFHLLKRTGEKGLQREKKIDPQTEVRIRLEDERWMPHTPNPRIDHS